MEKLPWELLKAGAVTYEVDDGTAKEIAAERARRAAAQWMTDNLGQTTCALSEVSTAIAATFGLQVVARRADTLAVAEPSDVPHLNGDPASRPMIPRYDPLAVVARHAEQQRARSVETARLEEIARLQARDEYEAAKHAAGRVLDRARERAAPASQPSFEPDGSVKRPTWFDVAGSYVVAVYKAGQFASAKLLFNHLESLAGPGPSPFEKGMGQNRGKLVIKGKSSPVSLKTFQNKWAAIQAAGASSS